jgi:hypothetical protein
MYGNGSFSRIAGFLDGMMTSTPYTTCPKYLQRGGARDMQ